MVISKDNISDWLGASILTPLFASNTSDSSLQVEIPVQGSKATKEPLFGLDHKIK